MVSRARNLAVALLLGLASASPVLGQNLPSDVEQKLGIRPNSGSWRGDAYRPLPSDVEQKLGISSGGIPSDLEQKWRRRAYRDHHYGHGYRPLPSDVEQKLGIWTGAIPSDVEQQLGRRAYRDYHYGGYPYGRARSKVVVYGFGYF